MKDSQLFCSEIYASVRDDALRKLRVCLRKFRDTKRTCSITKVSRLCDKATLKHLNVLRKEDTQKAKIIVIDTV